MFVFYGMSIFISALCSFGIRIDLCTMQHLEKNLFANQNCYAETGFKVENSRMQAREKKTLNSLLKGFQWIGNIVACARKCANCMQCFKRNLRENILQRYEREVCAILPIFGYLHA